MFVLSYCYAECLISLFWSECHILMVMPRDVFSYCCAECRIRLIFMLIVCNFLLLYWVCWVSHILIVMRRDVYYCFAEWLNFKCFTECRIFLLLYWASFFLIVILGSILFFESYFLIIILRVTCSCCYAESIRSVAFFLLLYWVLLYWMLGLGSIIDSC